MANSVSNLAVNTIANVASTSRFVDTDFITPREYGLWQVPNFLQPGFLADKEILALKIDSSMAGRPDLIANKYYQSVSLDWIVIMFNKPLNPLGWPTIGTIIKIPTSAAVQRYL